MADEGIMPLRIVMPKEQPPLFYFEKTGEGKRIAGIIIEIFNKVIKIFNTTYDLQLINSTAGLQLMKREEVDVLLVLEGNQFNPNYDNIYSSYLFFGDSYIYSNKLWKRVETLNNIWFSIQLKVWIYLLLTMIAISLIFWIQESMKGNFRSTKANLVDHIWILFGAFFAETMNRIPEDWSFKILAFIWMMSVFIISTVFSGSMKGQLTVTSGDDLNTLQDIVEHKNVWPFVTNERLEFQYLEISKDEYAKEVINKILASGGRLERAEEFFSSYTFINGKGRAAILMGHRMFYQLLKSHCDDTKLGYWYQSEEMINMFPIFLLVGKHVPESLKEEINVWIRRVGDAQVWEYIYRMDSYQIERCFLGRGKDNNYDPIQLHGLTMAFQLWLTGLLCSVLSLISEVILSKLKRN